VRTALALLVAVSVASAEPVTLRLKLKPSSGDLIETAKPCGKAIRNELWQRLFDTPWIEIVDDVMHGASKNLKGDPFIGEYTFEYKAYAIAVSLPKTRKQRTTSVSFTILYTLPNGTCNEKWIGLAEQW
jgi:hypothetical protein